jgi:hypothetical protein
MKTRDVAAPGPLANMTPIALADAHATLSTLLRDGEEVNLDRRDILLSMARTLQARAKGRAA